MFGAFGAALPQTCVSFVSSAAYQAGVAERLQLQRQVRPVERTRTLTKRDLERNNALPANTATRDVRRDRRQRAGHRAPGRSVSLNRLYFLS